MEWLIREYPEALSQRDILGRLPVHHACMAGCLNLEVIDLLMNDGRALFRRDCYGESPLSTAIQHGLPAESIIHLYTRDSGNVERI
jgi:ankyrin repeat protein